ncbi:MAG: carboxyl transferase domain-containing protein, partial [Pseudomonadota bacterium]|nr:carboxyl transferase domain-containing protein [Pseudomonadota bacterium]
ELCDAFHIPIISLMDCPGFLVGPEIEKQRMLSLTSRLLNAIIDASVHLVTVVLRKAIGLAYIALVVAPSSQTSSLPSQPLAST